MIYSRVVEAKFRSVFDQINTGDYTEMVEGLGGPFTDHFHAKHALGGRRTSRDSMVWQWQKVSDLLPGPQFTIHEVIVRGGSWHTRVAVRSGNHGPLPGGEVYSNTVFQFMTVK